MKQEWKFRKFFIGIALQSDVFPGLEKNELKLLLEQTDRFSVSKKIAKNR